MPGVAMMTPCMCQPGMRGLCMLQPCMRPLRIPMADIQQNSDVNNAANAPLRDEIGNLGFVRERECPYWYFAATKHQRSIFSTPRADSLNASSGCRAHGSRSSPQS